MYWDMYDALALALGIVVWFAGAFGAYTWYQGDLWWPCEEHINYNERALAQYELDHASWRKGNIPPESIVNNGYLYQLAPGQPFKPANPEPQYPVLWNLETSWGPATVFVRAPVVAWGVGNVVLVCYFIPLWLLALAEWVKRPRLEIAAPMESIDPSEYTPGQYINPNKKV
jgi:hypothetical protein